MVTLSRAPAPRRVPLLLAAWLGAAALGAGCQSVPLLAPSGSTITLTAMAAALPLNGSTGIIAQVIEASGTPPHSGTHVTFTTTLGTMQPSDAETDKNGRVTVQFLAGSTSGMAIITAISGGVSASGTNAVRIAVGAAAVGSVRIDANPAIVAAGGGTATVTAHVLDMNGNALPGVPVTFTTTAGSLSASVVTTDASGGAPTTLTTNRTATVTAAAGVASTGTGGGSGAGGAGSSSSQTSASVTVTANVASTIAVGTPSPALPTAGQAVTFPITYTQNASGSPVARVVVDFGDGSPAQTFNGAPGAVTHVYSTPGSYTVRATATDTFGDTAVGAGSVTVAAKAQPTVTISASANPTTGSATTFTIVATAPSGNVIQSVKVDFGDGSAVTLSGNATSVQHTYTSAGTFTVTAIATDNTNSSGSASTVIVVSGGSPTASFTVSPASGTTATTFSFNAADSTAPSGISSYAWDFGDGKTASGQSTTHQYAAAATYTVRLTVTDNNGKTATTTRTVTVS